MNAKPRSVSWSEELDALILKRCEAERMTRSEYIRKSVREEAERAHAKQILGHLHAFSGGQLIA